MSTNEKSESYVMTSLIFIELLKEDNMKNGMVNALNVIRYYLDADAVSILKEIDDNYKIALTDKQEDKTRAIDKNILEEYVNSNKEFLQTGRCLFTQQSENSESTNSFFYNINFDNKNYILGISNIKNKDNNHEYLNKLLVIFPLIIKAYLDQEKKQHEDALTGLGNRAKFTKKLEEIDKSDKPYIIGLFDLFRLKHINDNYSHNDGDDYIISGANILKETFGNVSNKTSIYRVGGDEFVVIAEGDNYELFKLLSEQCSEKTKELAFARINSIPLDMNFGIYARENKESGKEMCFKADKELQENKTKVYKSLGLDRRK